jgi:hypothetical protein
MTLSGCQPSAHVICDIVLLIQVLWTLKLKGFSIMALKAQPSASD